MPRPQQYRLQWTAPENTTNQRITKFNTVYLARHLLDQKGGFECGTYRKEQKGSIGCYASAYPELKSL